MGHLLPPLYGASFGSAPATSAYHGSGAPEPGRWSLELLRDKKTSPEELARLVNDFLAGTNRDIIRRRSEWSRLEARRRSFG